MLSLTHVVHCVYFLVFVYMDHVSELKLTYVCMLQLRYQVRRLPPRRSGLQYCIAIARESFANSCTNLSKHFPAIWTSVGAEKSRANTLLGISYS